MADQLSDEAKARKDLFWGLYTDIRTHARHAETLRTNVVNFMIVIASVLIAVIANDGHVSSKDLPLSLVIIVVGLIGVAFAASYTELYERNRKRAVKIRLALDAEFLQQSGVTTTSLLEAADLDHEASSLYKWSRRLIGSTRRFWFILPSLIIVAGVTLTLFAL